MKEHIDWNKDARLVFLGV